MSLAFYCNSVTNIYGLFVLIWELFKKWNDLIKEYFMVLFSPGSQ